MSLLESPKNLEVDDLGAQRVPRARPGHGRSDRVRGFLALSVPLSVGCARTRFCRSLQRLVPGIERRHLTTGGSGVRAQALAADGTPRQDFEFVVRSNALHLINAPSPGATASLAIADYLLAQAGEAWGWRAVAAEGAQAESTPH